MRKVKYNIANQVLVHDNGCESLTIQKENSQILIKNYYDYDSQDPLDVPSKAEIGHLSLNKDQVLCLIKVLKGMTK